MSHDRILHFFRFRLFLNPLVISLTGNTDGSQFSFILFRFIQKQEQN